MSNHYLVHAAQGCFLIAGATSLPWGHPLAAEVITVHKDPNAMLQRLGRPFARGRFSVSTVETRDIDALKTRLRTSGLAACNTAQVPGICRRAVPAFALSVSC